MRAIVLLCWYMPYKNIADKRANSAAWRAQNPDYYVNWYNKNKQPFTRKPKHDKELSGRDLNREKVRQRDNHTCQDCKKKWSEGARRFDVHHLDGLCGKKSRKYDKCDDLNRLITLCHRCHFKRPDHTFHAT
jgi:hypothetical protein